MQILLLFIGLIIGSFLNAFLYRYETKQTLGGRSFCPKCKKQIAWYDNVPIFSWLVLRGKCRNCKKPISAQYPVVELVTGIVFLLVGIFSKEGKAIESYLSQLFNGSTVLTTSFPIIDFVKLFLLVFIFSVLILISVYDIKTKEIPNGFNAAIVVGSFLYLALGLFGGNYQEFGYYLLAGVVGFLFFWSLVYFSKETWMGGGDAKLALGMGFLLGPAGTFVAIFLASILGSIYGLGALGIQKIIRNSELRTRNSHEIPFGPFLAMGTFMAFLFGSQIINWYVKIILGL